jgi:hypothetical protein
VNALAQFVLVYVLSRDVLFHDPRNPELVYITIWEMITAEEAKAHLELLRNRR